MKKKKKKKGKEEIDTSGRRGIEGRISIKEKYFGAFKFLFKYIVPFSDPTLVFFSSYISFVQIFVSFYK